jgi:hypothetical protein
VSPTGNIRCIAIVYGARKGSMRCSLNRIAKLLPRPEWAQCDWEGGKLFSLHETAAGERASFCDAFGGIYKPPTRLAYGRTWQRGPFTCLSSQLGLLCTNVRGHGLFLSYGQQRFF